MKALIELWVPICPDKRAGITENEVDDVPVYFAALSC